MWPFTLDQQGLWLALYVLTLSLHAVFVGYVLIGSAYVMVQALRRAEDPLATQVRDYLPFMLGCGITAGVAPLLFLQLLYQRHFYSSNLIMGPRWGAVVPALIIGFYALYLAKSQARERVRTLALVVATLCFLFVAWSWTEIHQLMNDEPAWKAMYAAGSRIYDGAVIPRLALWLGVMTTLFATVAAWHAPAARGKLAAIAIAGRIVAGIAVAVLGGSVDTHGWSYLLIAGVALELAGWIAVLRAPGGAGLLLATAGGTAVLVAGAVVREAPRIAMLEPVRDAAAAAGGLPVFLLTLVLGIAAIGWIAKTIR